MNNHIIILNGASSSGKSSILKELQLLFPEPYIGMGVDRFMSMVSSAHQGFGAHAEQMWAWKKSQDSTGKELMELKLGHLGKRYIMAMYTCISQMAHEGFPVIVDDVCMDKALLQKIAAEILSEHTVYFIGVHCSLPVLEERERLRNNRVINSARGQYELVHQGYEYDFTVDTSNTTAHDCAVQIKNYIETNSVPQAMKNLIKKSE